MTAAERRQLAREEFDAYFSTCPSRQVLDRLANKWVILALVALSEGPQRYSELSRRLASVSQKMLTQTLRGLERDGLVTRHLEPAVPIRVSYELTDLGHSLLAVTRQLKQWAEQHVVEIHQAREEYDALP
jgi:DNA-binding HxlR family transcriptional regulator